MNQLTTALLSAVMVLGGTPGSQAADTFAQDLPLRGTVEASMARAYDLLTAMEGSTISPKGAQSFWAVFNQPGTPAKMVIIGHRQRGAQGLQMGCLVEGDQPPAAEQLCQEVERRYLQAP
jgi:hypothetical protein